MLYHRDVGLISACAFKHPLGPHQVGILIMGQLKKDDFQTTDERLVKLHSNGWRHYPDLAPEGKLVYRLKKTKTLSWNNFVAAYLKKLATDPAAIAAVKELIALAQDYQVVIACVEESPTLCHRQILVRWCKLLDPSLKMVIL